MKINICNDPVTVPEYAVHEDGKIYGFFGPFSFLSNFYILETAVCLEGLYFPSVEHAFQAAKWPPHLREQFTRCSSGKAKRLGRKSPYFDEEKWNKKKLGLMRELCFQKFTNDSKLNKMLLMTEGYELKETNNWGNTYWGCNEAGEGENNLGKILMDIREELLKLEKKKKKFFKNETAD